MSTTDKSREVISEAIAHIEIPPYVPPTPGQLEQSRRAAERAKALREEIGPIDIRTDELVHVARMECDPDE
jgi:hypothetical protein